MTPNQKRALAAALATGIAGAHEGLKFTPYYDPPGILTVCQGHTGPDVIKGKRYSLAECDAFLTDDMRKAVGLVDACQPGLPVPVLASFADAVFNGGPTIACNRTKSTAARLLYAHDYAAACEQHLRWNKAKVAGVMVVLPGLTTRTIERRNLCMEGL